MEGVTHFIDYKCVPGNNSWVPWSESEEIFSSGKIHYAGQAIGLILAETPDLAREAAGLVKVTYKNKRPVVVNIKEAMKDEARVVKEFPTFFGFSPRQILVGEHQKSQDLVQVEGQLELGSQYHFYMETLTALCRPKEDKQIQLWASTQWMDFTQNLVASALGISVNSIDMNVKRIGGGYGGKATPAFFVAISTAVASWTVNRPVRFVMDLKSNMAFTGLREPYVANYKAEVDPTTQKLNHIEVTFHADCGWTASECLSMAETMTFAQNAYTAKSWDLTPVGILTDRPRGTAVRAPGTTQGHTIIENVMEHLAAKLNVDPVEFRIKNFMQDGDLTVAGLFIPEMHGT